MQLTLHATRPTPHGASSLVLAMSAWSVKTRRAPSRRFGDARVYGHTTTAMHDNEHTPRLVRIKIAPEIRSRWVIVLYLRVLCLVSVYCTAVYGNMCGKSNSR